MTDPLSVPYYLVSVDLEDIRSQASAGEAREFRVPAMVERFLRFFDDHKIKCTFFVEGRTVERIGDLIREAGEAGHEIGCHSHSHTPLDKLTPQEFREDLARNIEALQKQGVDSFSGFRAPDFSLTHATRWAWDVLAELGFLYSSSVLPARNPLYGWAGFSRSPVRLDNGLWELPISVASLAGIKLPFAGGVYLRFFPTPVVRNLSRRFVRRPRPLVGYFHPYDIDVEEERYRVEDNLLFNWLVFYNRASALPKLAHLCEDFTAVRFLDYVRILDEERRSGSSA
jgi:polysaccharide deacetylase family protein (PEP-CTERM system associated)